MTARLYIPADAAAVAVGAGRVARAIAAEAAHRGLAVEIVRTGSRGLYWLEPMVEVATAEGRIAFGPVHPTDVPALFDGGLLEGRGGRLRLGPPETIPFLARQTRRVFARCGVIDPDSLADYEAHGGLAGLRAALAMGPDAVIAAITASGLRGMGGAGFPAGVKWKATREAEGARKFIVANADEGDSGSFADRMLMEGDPFLLLEGMAIAGLAAGAEYGFVYIRSEYPHAIARMKKAVATARQAGLLGAGIPGSGPAFDVEIRVGAGAYIAGEETALLESIEGKRGQVRAKPPLPVRKGLFGCPTTINNVITLAAAPLILAGGAEAWAALGHGRSRGTIPIQLAGNIRRGGLFETTFGITLGELVNDVGGGTETGRPVKAVQVGGPLGAYFPPALFDTPIDYEAFTARDGLIGHGGIVVFDDTVDMFAQARFAFEFCAIESCGKCTPCRVGSVRGVEVMDRLRNGAPLEDNRRLIDDLCETMRLGSLCALGGFTPIPVQSAMRHFPEDFAPRSSAGGSP